jgi:Lar family restriction alleviation protein
MTHEPDTDGRAEVLLPCPFCGGDAQLQVGLHSFDDALIACTNCCAEGPLCNEAPFKDEARDYNRAEAITAWNTRTAPLHVQAKAAGYASVAEWVAAKDAEIARYRENLKHSQGRFLNINIILSSGGTKREAIAIADLGENCIKGYLAYPATDCLARQALAGDA